MGTVHNGNDEGTVPIFPTLFDSHAHLDAPEFKSDLDAVIRRARGVGVAGIVAAGTDVESTKTSIQMAHAYEGVYATVGYHPNDSTQFGKAAEEALRALCSDPKVVAIGETGLDYYRDHAPKETQRDAFLRHIQMALDFSLPVIVHNREAAEDCLTILREFRGRLRGVAHCFSGSEETARAFLDLGFYVSIAGPVTFSNARNLTQIARLVPDDRLLIETDCPWLAPAPMRGKRNEPAFVRYTAQIIAGLRRVSTHQLGEIITRNARELFRIS